jgi:hypothetical protein
MLSYFGKTLTISPWRRFLRRVKSNITTRLAEESTSSGVPFYPSIITPVQAKELRLESWLSLSQTS